MAVFCVVASCSLVGVSEVLAASIIRATARTSETMVNFYQTTQRCNPEDSNLRTADMISHIGYHVASCYGVNPLLGNTFVTSC
jgi:hypothetical protein